MILVWGPASDPPVARMVAVLRERGCEVMHIDESALAELRYDIRLEAKATGWIESGGQTLPLDRLAGLYLRPGDRSAQLAPAAAGAVAKASAALMAVAATSAATVVNRPSAGRSNWSKPYQSRLIADAGFAVPDTLVTTDPAAARAFLREHQRIVYKSISGVRSIVATLDTEQEGRLAGVATGPVQFQQWIDGRDIRVHVVGTTCFATAVDSEADDYRYAGRDGAELTLAPFELPADLAGRLVAISRQMGLLVAGIDLRLTANGEWFCFEVNPSPGFTFYEEATGQPIAAAIADLLMLHRSRRQR